MKQGCEVGDKPLIYDFDLEELQRCLNSWGEPSFRAHQIWQGLYCSLWDTPQRFTTLPKTLQGRLNESFLFSHLTPQKFVTSSNNSTQKVLFHLPADHPVETILMRQGRRNSLCVSSQVGCAMGCVFCATGQLGFQRNLSSGEMIEQVLFFSRQLIEQHERITHIVVMGMGEPFHNYDATMSFIDRLNHPEGLNFGARRITISTVGIVPAIRRFSSEDRQVNLAISLHAADNDLRSSLLPVNRKYPLEELLDACVEYVERTHRRISFEWALIKAVNDTHEQANKLANLLHRFLRKGSALCHVNLILLNPTQGYSGEPSSNRGAKEFQAELISKGIPCTIRQRLGIDIQAGCGQLAGKAV